MVKQLLQDTVEEQKNSTLNKYVQNLWLDMRLTKEVMDYLWDIISRPNPPEKMEEVAGPKFRGTKANYYLAGNISKSLWLQDDKSNLIFGKVLQDFAEMMYYRNWDNYYNIHIAKIVPAPVFQVQELWVNYQKQHEFNPPHKHNGFYSFVVFMKIPTHWKEQHALPISANSNIPCASNFQFLLGQGQNVQAESIPLSPEDEGRILFFPSWLTHQVFPFYGTEEERITVSGNIKMDGVPLPHPKSDPQ